MKTIEEINQQIAQAKSIIVEAENARKMIEEQPMLAIYEQVNKQNINISKFIAFLRTRIPAAAKTSAKKRGRPAKNVS